MTDQAQNKLEKNPLHERKTFPVPTDGFAHITAAVLAGIPIISNIPEYNSLESVTDDGSGKQVLAHLSSAKLPAGHMIVWQPFMKRAETKGEARVFQFAIAGHCPGVEVFQNDPKAAAWMFDAVIERMVRVFKASAAELVKGEEGAKLPESLDDFIESGGRDRGLTEFNEIAGDAVKQLRDAGMKGITKEQLKMLLQSKSFSDATYGDKLANFWPRLIDKLAAEIKRKGGTASLLDTWRRTRDQKAAALEREIDFAALGISLDDVEAADPVAA